MQGWKQPQGWGWDEEDEEDDYRSNVPAVYDDLEADSSEEVQDDDASGSAESDENDDSAEDDQIFLRNALPYDPIYY